MIRSYQDIAGIVMAKFKYIIMNANSKEVANGRLRATDRNAAFNLLLEKRPEEIRFPPDIPWGYLLDIYSNEEIFIYDDGRQRCFKLTRPFQA